jgi:hypothetical protein
MKLASLALCVLLAGAAAAQDAEPEPPACDDPDVMRMLHGFQQVHSRNPDVEPYHVRWCSAVAEGPGLRQRKQYTVEWMRERKSAMLPGGPIRTPDGTMWVQLRGGAVTFGHAAVITTSVPGIPKLAPDLHVSAVLLRLGWHAPCSAASSTSIWSTTAA